MRRPLFLFPVLMVGTFALAASGADAQTRSGTGTKQQRCYDVEVQKPKEVKDPNKITGSVVGGLAGGLLGNQIGGGSGKKIATAAGAVGGVVAGRKIQENQQNKTETVIERRCE